jgi:hypothetical protein
MELDGERPLWRLSRHNVALETREELSHLDCPDSERAFDKFPNSYN